MVGEALLERNPKPSEREVREAIAGNLCRCTGYVKIVEAFMVASGQAGEAPQLDSSEIAALSEDPG
jgi:carbon-monoxide dehydrogenase small subunit